MSVTAGPKPNLFLSVLTNKCPHCRRGNLFVDPNPYNLRNTMKMPEKCPVCGQNFELQTGFYFGTGFVSYGLSVMLIAIGFAVWAMAFGLSVKDNSIFWCLGVNIGVLLLLQPVLQRLSRSIWIALFVKYEPAATY
jgi:uncharacterized protein (DUF983 family)